MHSDDNDDNTNLWLPYYRKLTLHEINANVKLRVNLNLNWNCTSSFPLIFFIRKSFSIKFALI